MNVFVFIFSTVCRFTNCFVVLCIYFFCLGILLPTIIIAKGKATDIAKKTIKLPQVTRYISFHPKRKTLVALSLLNRVLLWDFSNENTKSYLRIPACTTKGMYFSPKGRYLLPINLEDRNCQKVQAKDVNAVQFWDLQEGAKLVSLRHHSGKLIQLTVDLQEQRIATVSSDGIVKVWLLKSKELLYNLRLRQSFREPLSLLPYTLSPTWQVAAVYNWQDYYMLLYTFPTKLYDSTSAKTAESSLLHRSEYPFSNEQSLFCFSPNSQYYFDGLRLRRVKDGNLVAALRYPKDSRPLKAVFSHYRRQLAVVLSVVDSNITVSTLSGSIKNKPKYVVNIYSYPRGLLLRSLTLSFSVKALAFHPNSRWLTISDDRGYLYFFSITS